MHHPHGHRCIHVHGKTCITLTATIAFTCTAASPLRVLHDAQLSRAACCKGLAPLVHTAAMRLSRLCWLHGSMQMQVGSCRTAEMPAITGPHARTKVFELIL